MISGWVKKRPMLSQRIGMSSKRFLIMWGTLLLYYKVKPTETALEDMHALATTCLGSITLSPDTRVYLDYSRLRRHPMVVVETETDMLRFTCDAGEAEMWLEAMDKVCYSKPLVRRLSRE